MSTWGNLQDRGWGWLHDSLPLLLESQARQFPLKGVSGTRCGDNKMAVQRVGPGELIPQMAQTPYMPLLVNGEACVLPSVVFLSLQLPVRVVCGRFVGSGWLPGRNTEAPA